MSLIRGLNGKCPCPICEVITEELSNLTAKYPRRDAEEIMKIVTDQTMLKRDMDALLQEKGLRRLYVRPYLLLNDATRSN